ncbi:MAG: DUF2249 domain-containing protein [Gemmatimonadaceae bacterium]
MSGVREPTPVTAADRLSDVLARDESLIEVFVRHAPHFAKLRNRAMRRVMARLVTVEQAARTASVSTEQLVHDLNDALGINTAAPTRSRTADQTPLAGDAARHPTARRVVGLDVRDDLRSGREPFSRIMAAVAELPTDAVLQLRTMFEPAPLYAVLGKRGLAHEACADAADDWRIWFWRAEGATASAEAGPNRVAPAQAPADSPSTQWLDVRGLTPPEPLVRTLAALELLPGGHTLVHLNNRVPQFLLPMLAERGFAYETDENRDGAVHVRIWRPER